MDSVRVRTPRNSAAPRRSASPSRQRRRPRRRGRAMAGRARNSRHPPAPAARPARRMSPPWVAKAARAACRIGELHHPHHQDAAAERADLRRGWRAVAQPSARAAPSAPARPGACHRARQGRDIAGQGRAGSTSAPASSRPPGGSGSSDEPGGAVPTATTAGRRGQRSTAPGAPAAAIAQQLRPHARPSPRPPAPASASSTRAARHRQQGGQRSACGRALERTASGCIIRAVRMPAGQGPGRAGAQAGEWPHARYARAWRGPARRRCRAPPRHGGYRPAPAARPVRAAPPPITGCRHVGTAPSVGRSRSS